MNRKLWAIFLACWMAMFAFLALTDVKFKLSDVIMGLLAAAVVICVIIDK